MPNPLLSVEASTSATSLYSYGLKDTFENIFEIHSQTDVPSEIMSLFKTVEVDGAFMVAQAYGAPPLPVPIIRGEERATNGFGDYTFELFVHDYGTPIFEWHVDDAQDERATLKARQRVEDAAKHLRMLDRYVFAELLAGSASTYLHPDTSFTTIFGSTGLFSSSHSYGGQSLDNDLAGSGTAFSNVYDDLYTMFSTFDSMVADNGVNYWNAMKTDDTEWLWIVPTAMRKIVHQIMLADMVNSGGGTSPESNYFRTAMGEKFTPFYHELLTDTDDHMLFRMNTDQKPLLSGIRKDMQTDDWNMTNSDYSRAKFMERVAWWLRRIFGVGNPLTAVRTAN